MVPFYSVIARVVSRAAVLKNTADAPCGIRQGASCALPRGCSSQGYETGLDFRDLQNRTQKNAVLYGT